MHYIGAIVLIFIVFYHVFVHGIQKQFDALPKKGDLKASYHIIKAMITKGEEPPSDKYLAEQRLAYLAIGIVIMLLIITGMIKMAKNSGTFSIPEIIVIASTQIHNAATFMIVLLIIGHLAAFLIKANRKLIPGMLSGYVEKEYVKHRHSIWYKKLESKKAVSSNNGQHPAPAKRSKKQEPLRPKEVFSNFKHKETARE